MRSRGTWEDVEWVVFGFFTVLAAALVWRNPPPDWAVYSLLAFLVARRWGELTRSRRERLRREERP